MTDLTPEQIASAQQVDGFREEVRQVAVELERLRVQHLARMKELQEWIDEGNRRYPPTKAESMARHPCSPR